MARIISDPINSYRGRIGKISYYIRKCENMARKSSSAGKISASPAAVAQAGTIAGKRLHVLE